MNYTVEVNREYISSKISKEKLMRILLKSYEKTVLRCWFLLTKIVMVSSLQSDAATDGENRIFILNPNRSEIMSSLTNEELAVYVLGLIIHELFHLFWTNVKYTVKVCTALKNGELAKEYPNLTKLCKLSPMAGYSIAFSFCNITEDAHINRKGKKNYPRYAFPLNYVYKRFNKLLRALKTITRPDGSINRLGVFMEYANYFAIRGLTPDLDGIPEDLKKICIRSRKPILDIIYEDESKTRTNASLAYLDKVISSLIDLSEQKGQDRKQQQSQIDSDAEQAQEMLDNEQSSSSSREREKPNTVPNEKLEKKDRKNEDKERGESSSESETEKSDSKAPSEAPSEAEPEEQGQREGGSSETSNSGETKEQTPFEESSQSGNSLSGQNSSETKEDQETGGGSGNGESEDAQTETSSAGSSSDETEPSGEENSETAEADDDAEADSEGSDDTDGLSDGETDTDDETEDGEEDDFDLSDYCDEDEPEDDDSSDDEAAEKSGFDRSAFLESIQEELEKEEREEQEQRKEENAETKNLLEKTRNSCPSTNFHRPVDTRPTRLKIKDSNGLTLLPETKATVKKYAAQVVRKVEQEVKTRTEGGVRTHLLGGRLNGHRVMDFVTKNNLDKYRLFDKSYEGEDGLSIAVEMLIDESGSMSGKNASNAVAVAAILHETCRRLQIPIRICSFNTETYLYCDFDEPCESTFEYRLCEYKANGGTDEAQALLLLEKSLFDRPEKYKYLFLISDGQPGFRSPCGAKTWLKEYQKYSIDKGIQFVACCTGYSSKAVAEIYDGPKIIFDEYDALAERLTREITRSII